jgi:hypothetical protein
MPKDQELPYFTKLNVFGMLPLFTNSMLLERGTGWADWDFS